MENELTTLSDRLRFILKILGISQTELARRINVKPQIIQYLCAGNSEKTKFMFDIAEALNIDVSWLATGKGESPSIADLSRKENTIPILTFSEVKDWKIDRKQIDLTKNKKIPIHEDIGDNSFAIILNDQSMAPRFNINTIIIIDPIMSIDQVSQNNRFALVYLVADDFLVFRQLEVINKEKNLIPLNNNLFKKTIMTDKDILLGICKEARWNV